jgi:rare lipoprotein A
LQPLLARDSYCYGFVMKSGTLRQWRIAGGVVTALLLLTGCAETQLVVNSSKYATHDQGNKVYPYKVGKPYQVAGAWYYPKIDYGYDETGIASWYGPGFHGGPTASGESYDENALTAAHKTLPLPSLVRVTNLQNGRSIEVRINDRGPFVNNRIIDLSRRAAQLLAIDGPGTAPVRVQILADESRALAAAASGGNTKVAQTKPTPARQPAPPPAAQPPAITDGAGIYSGSDDGTIQQAALDPIITTQPVPQPSGHVSVQPVHPTNLYIQAGAFTQIGNAQNLTSKLSRWGKASIKEAWVGQQHFYRVRVGPLPSVDDADRLLQDIIDSGSRDARIVVD